MAGKEYQMAFSIGAKLQGQFGTAFKGAQTSVAALQNQIQSLNKQQGDVAAYQKQQKAIEQTKARLQMLQQQYANLKASMAENGEESVDLKNKMLAKELQIERTTQKLEGQEAQLQATGNALNEAGIDTQNLATASKELESEISDLKGQQEELAAATEETGQSMSDAANSMMELIGALGLAEALKVGYEAMKACTEEAIAFENSMAAVKRTVGGDDAFLSDLGASFKELSTVIPISTAELTEIATTAGQLGIAQDDVQQFTTVMAQLATTTDLTANDAATMLAQFSNITGIKEYDRLGSVIAELGDSTATTASKVVQMSQGMAASASQAGMTSTDIMAISAALGSLGIEAQAGATSMSQLISTLYKATETGEGLKDFAAVAGMSAEQFKQAWATDAVGAMNAFIQGLNDTERNGKSAIVILDELGITNVRQTKAILGLASAGDLLSRTISQANNAWVSNTALTQKAQVMYETTQAKLTMLNNAFNNTKIAIGDAFTPAVSAAATALTGMLKPVTAFIERNPALVRAFAAAAAVIGTVIVALTAYAAVAKIAAAASALLVAAIPGMKLIMGITLAIAGLVAGITLLVDAFNGGRQSMEELDAEFDSLNEQIKEQQEIIDLCEQYKALQKELDNTQKSIEDVQGLSDVGIDLTAEVAAQLSPEDFVDGTEFDLTAQQANELSKMDYIPDGTLIELTAQAANQLAAAGFLDNQSVLLTAEKANQLIAAGYLDSSDVELTAKPENTLTGNSFMSGTMVKLTPEAAKKLAAIGFLEGSKVQLTPEIASYLQANGFLTGTTVSLTAQAAYKLAATGFLNGTKVQLTAEAANKLIAAGFLDASTVSLTGQAGNTVGTDEFVPNTTVNLTANFTNLADLQKAVEELQSKASTVKADLSTAKDDLGTMKQRYEELEARMKYAGNASDKSAIQSEMEALSGAIGEQEKKVGDLETAYTNVSAELMITSGAANDLAAKEAALKSVKEQLAEASGGVASATSGETKKFEEQVEVIEALAKAKQAELRQQVADNAAKQAKAYADATRTAASNQVLLNSATADFNRYSEYSKQGLAGMQAALNGAYESYYKLSMENWKTGSTDTSGLDEARQKVEDLLYLLTGEKYDFSFTGLRGMSDAMENANASWGNVTKAEGEAAANVQKYQDAVDEANAVQKAFVDNLVSGVRDGGMTIEQVEGILTETFANTSNGAELVQQIMAQVKAELEGAADAADGMGDGMDSTVASAEQVSAAIGPIIAEMEKLGAAYQQAYEKAYESMDGQFKLFEKAPELTKESVDDMIASLQSQQKYMEEYAANLQAAADMGLSDGLLAKLSDGSAESAAYLQAIVSEGATKIDELNTAFAGVEEGKTDFANTVAEMQTDFSTKMGELQSQLETTVSEMNMSSDAAAAGTATVQAFADAASSLTPTVTAAFQRVANAAKAALKVSISAGPNGINAYASGTQSAEPGFALVGENGPELVYFNGGEQVATAEETEALSNRRALDADPISAIPGPQPGGNTVHIEVKPEYTINGSANPDELRSVLNEQTQHLRTMVEDILEDIESDRERSAYS